MREAACADFFERAQNAVRAQVERVVVGERQEVEAQVPEAVEDERVGRMQEGRLHRPSAVRAAYRAFVSGEGEVARADERGDVAEGGCLIEEYVFLDQG